MSKLCSLPPKTLGFENHLHPFELLHKDVLYYDCNTNESLIPLTMKIKDIHLSPFRFFHKKDHQFENASEKDHEAFISLQSI